MIESAKIDGASEWRVFFQIVVPLSTPALATVGLFMILIYWNDWWLPLLYIDSPDKYPAAVSALLRPEERRVPDDR